MDLTFQVPMQYCSLHHQTLLPSPVTSTTGCCFYFGSISSFFLELCLHWSLVVYWAPTDLGSSSFCVLFFFLFILFIGFSRQEYWSGLPLLQWITFCQTSPWPIHLGWAHTGWLSFFEFDNDVFHVIRWARLLWLWFVCLPSDASSNTYHLTWYSLTWDSLTLDVEYLFTAAPARHSCCSLPWTRGISLPPMFLTLTIPSCGCDWW